MKGNLAIHGGPRTVPKGLKKRWPEITQVDKDAVMAVLDRNILTGHVHGPEAGAFEKEWAEFTGSQHALAFNNGTAAIHTALFAAGVRPGDEVITSAFSFSGSFQPILHQHAIPIFVDIDPHSYNIDASQIEAKITDRTKVLLPVHIHGLPADMDEILALAEKYDLIVVEDACQAHGATYKGRMVGVIGDMGCFSLNATKNLSGGEGGFLNTDNEKYVERAKLLRTFGEKIGQEKEKFRPYRTITPSLSATASI
jgi:dTDP-4-amino-4,6-dideoxygalactose transaminase